MQNTVVCGESDPSSLRRVVKQVALRRFENSSLPVQKLAKRTSKRGKAKGLLFSASETRPSGAHVIEGFITASSALSKGQALMLCSVCVHPRGGACLSKVENRNSTQFAGTKDAMTGP